MKPYTNHEGNLGKGEKEGSIREEKFVYVVVSGEAETRVEAREVYEDI